MVPKYHFPLKESWLLGEVADYKFGVGNFQGKPEISCLPENMKAINLNWVSEYYSQNPKNTLPKAMSCFLITYLHV